MFASPHTFGGWVGFVVLWLLVAYFSRAAWLTATRVWRDRATVDRLGRIPVDPPTTPRRCADPSPRPRVARLVADGCDRHDRDTLLRAVVEGDAQR